MNDLTNSEKNAIQDLFPEEGTHCFGCGRNNPNGLQIKTFCEGEECICKFTPRPHHMAYPEVGCGGIISTVLDCHSINSAMYAAYKAENREVGSKPDMIYATASMTINFLKPAPMHNEWLFTAKITDFSERRITVKCRVTANGVEFANGTVIAAKIK
ncbi:MAG: PaaI family thioesterase [Promethearchaeota archaeon]